MDTVLTKVYENRFIPARGAYADMSANARVKHREVCLMGFLN